MTASIVGIVDATVIVHLYRKRKDALAWLKAQPDILSITLTTWFEMAMGATSKATLAVAETVMEQFSLELITSGDQRWAMQQMKRYRFTDHPTVNDCLIAAFAYRLQLPLYTHNAKDMRVLLYSKQVVVPYPA